MQMVLYSSYADGHVFFSFVDIRHDAMCEQTCNARHMAMCYVMDVYELVLEDQTWRLGVTRGVVC